MVRGWLVYVYVDEIGDGFFASQEGGDYGSMMVVGGEDEQRKNYVVVKKCMWFFSHFVNFVALNLY